MSNEKAKTIWADVIETVKDNVMSPSVFVALEAAVPIDEEPGLFIIGFASQDLPKAGYLRAASVLPLIERCLTDHIGQETVLEIVEGSSLEEYQRIKEIAEIAKKAVSRSTAARQAIRKVDAYWEEIGEKCTRGFARCENRGFNTTKADFMSTAWGFINEGLEHFDYDNNKDQLHERCLSRVFDKLGNSMELPPAILAYLFFEWRKAQKK
ncbi:MAG: hypothetical protein IK083_00620 [Abditibacteriota bacterium]|nr:hypothetical protein [Abditibacteriota bacterium]